MAKHYYWKCLTCGRRFLSFQVGGHDVTCPCGEMRNMTETTKADYDAYILERLSFK